MKMRAGTGRDVAVGALIGLTMLLAACGGSNETNADSAATTSTPSTSTPDTSVTTSTTDPPAVVTDPSDGQTEQDCPNRATGRSPSQFNSTGGTYAVEALAVDPSSSALSFDVVQWLSGEAALAAWHVDHPGDPDGPPNDYYIVNSSDHLRTAPIASDATVRLTHLRTDGSASVEPDSVDGLRSYIGSAAPTDVYWLTVRSGTVTEICEQFRP